MKPNKFNFERAYVPKEQQEATIKAMVARWDAGEKIFRDAFPGPSPLAAIAIREYIQATAEKDYQIFRSDVYQVAVRHSPGMIHLSIKRNDREPIHDWRDMQQIKNVLVGPEFEAVEIYPAESRVVDTANQYHLWVFDDPTFRLPFGFDERYVTEDNFCDSKQRPFEKEERVS